MHCNLMNKFEWIITWKKCRSCQNNARTLSMELHPIIKVSIDDTISLKQNTELFSLAACTVITTYTTIVWSVKLQQHPKTAFVVIRALRGILEQKIWLSSVYTKNTPHSLKDTPPLPLQMPMPASYNITKPHTRGLNHTSSQKQLCVSFIQIR